MAGATQPKDGANNQRKPGQRQLATHATQITSTTQKLPQDQGQGKDRKGKVPNHHFHNLRRNTRGPRRTRFWGGRGLGREDRECKDGHRKAEGRRSGRAWRPNGGPKRAGEGQKGRSDGLKGLLPRGRWPELAWWRRPQVLLARPARRAGLGSSARAPGGCPQVPISYQKTTRPLKRVRPPAPPFPRLWLFAIDSAFWGWFLGFPGFLEVPGLDPGFGLLGSG